MPVIFNINSFFFAVLSAFLITKGMSNGAKINTKPRVHNPTLLATLLPFG